MVLAKLKPRSLLSNRHADCTKYQYDLESKPIVRLYSDATRVTQSYDAVGQRKLLFDSTGRTTSSYDSLGRVSVVCNPDLKRITYGYDSISQRITMRDPDNSRFSYYYDATGLLSSLRNPQSERSTFTHDALGRRTVSKLANLVRASMSYDVADRLVTLANVKADGTFVSKYDYAYDNTVNKTRVIEANGDRVTWSYDRTYQLTRERRSGANAYDTTYTYDAAMNRHLEIDSTVRTTYTCDAANQLQWTQDGSGRTTYTFDQAGNQALQVAPNLDRTTHVWDVENRMSQMRHPNATRSTYTYNGDNLRVKAEEPAATRKIIWDGQIYLIETDGANTTQATYTNEPNTYGYILSQRRSSNTSYYHADGPGSVANLTNASATLIDSYLYRAFGINIASSGLTENPFKYCGTAGYYTTVNGYYIRNRWIDPSIAKWLSRDPLFNYNDINLFLYSVNNPILNIDPSGLLTILNRTFSKYDDCDKPHFFAWKYYLDRKGGYPLPGYIVQKVSVECKVHRCGTDPDKPLRFSYYEAWPIPKNEITHVFTDPVGNYEYTDKADYTCMSGYCGKYTQTAEARYYTIWITGDLEKKGWKKNQWFPNASTRCKTTSNSLIASKDKPSFWDGTKSLEDSAFREYKVEWRCCKVNPTCTSEGKP